VDGAVSLPVPKRTASHPQAGNAVQGIVVRGVLLYRMSLSSQEFVFGGQDLILATGLLIEIMNLQNSHDQGTLDAEFSEASF
jgi:hypothetical protein